MQAVAAERRTTTTNGHLDRLVVTHEHWDHLSGFLQAQAIFDTVEVGEVWLAWTEDPDDELAAELRKHKKKALDGIVAAASSRTPARLRPRSARRDGSTRCSTSRATCGAAGTKTTARRSSG